MAYVSTLYPAKTQNGSPRIITLYNVFSTSGDVQYIEGCSVHWGDIMSTLGGYHEYIRGCSVHQRDTIRTSGDIMSTSGDVQYIGGIHDTCGGTT